jgi:hypothetical protein
MVAQPNRARPGLKGQVFRYSPEGMSPRSRTAPDEMNCCAVRAPEPGKDRGRR